MAKDDFDIALCEMQETQDDVKNMVLTDQFKRELARVRLDLGVSPYVNLTDEMCKWVLLAQSRSTAVEQPTVKHYFTVEHCLWARNGNTPCPHLSKEEKS